MLLQLAPPSVLICHWNDVAPGAADVKVTGLGEHTVWLVGCVVIVGALGVIVNVMFAVCVVAPVDVPVTVTT